MTISTVEHADYSPAAAVNAVVPPITDADVTEADERHVQALSVRERPTPDPGARARLADVLFRITGWEIFSDDERGYVSRLWAEDWDSAEDATYDES